MELALKVLPLACHNNTGPHHVSTPPISGASDRDPLSMSVPLKLKIAHKPMAMLLKIVNEGCLQLLYVFSYSSQ
ncbi:unnamed protein product [Rhodiola kirilowii]